jgi:hypothetical protein
MASGRELPLIEPAIQAAFAVQTTPGGYALLLGSGISRSAEIPTGWDVVIDLVRKVAALAGADASADPVEFYRDEFGSDPDYSKLLEQLAGTPAERQAILRGYFEPTEDERERGAKSPTTAHRAIARLVAASYIKVIITTNFDRLLEDALAEEGVRPYVVRAAADIPGAPPVGQLACLVVKVHGDYLDTRLRNTPRELATYEPELDALLDRLLDDHGLIVCGWSADWDEALRAAVRRIQQRRLTCFWATVHDPSILARDLIANRGAVEVHIPDADGFFVDLSEKVAALADLRERPPATVELAVATAKRLLADQAGRIRLRDLVKSETESILVTLAGLGDDGEDASDDEFERRIVQLESASAKLAAIVAAGAYWGDTPHTAIWTEAIQRLGDRGYDQGYQHLSALRGYAATLVMYSGAVGALAAGRYDSLAAILKVPVRRKDDQHPAAYVLEAGLSLENSAMNRLRKVRENKPNTTYYVPASERVRETVRRAVNDEAPDDSRFGELMDRVEALIALVYADHGDTNGNGMWFPLGLHQYRAQQQPMGRGTLNQMARDLAEQGASWGPVAAGLFSSPERATALIEGYKAQRMPF